MQNYSGQSQVGPTGVHPHSLSTLLTEILEESTKLLNLKAQWGRMPEGRLRRRVLGLIDQWFEEMEPVELNSLRLLVDIWRDPAIGRVLKRHFPKEDYSKLRHYLKEVYELNSDVTRSSTYRNEPDPDYFAK